MASIHRIELPRLATVPIQALGLPARLQEILLDSQIYTIGQLNSATDSQKQHVKANTTPADIQAVIWRLRHFYASYKAVKEILTKTVDDSYPKTKTSIRSVSNDEKYVERNRPTVASSRRHKLRETGPLWSPHKRPDEPILDPHSPLSPIERKLRQRLHRVDFIGELAVEEVQFEAWCKLVRREALRGGRARPKLVPPALFVALMVFAARYSEEKHRTFWEPYAQMVWDLDEASQYFQIQCRNRFGEAIAFLADTYDMTFPQRSPGDLVRPVYRHAIIPAYLEPTFVEWLKSRWQEVLEIPPDYLTAHLQQERSLRYLPPTLYRFIDEPDTAEAAADLIRNMAFAASLYDEGKSLKFIGGLLEDSPIEQTLWEEFANVLTSREESAGRRSRARLEWVWSLETTEMMLRLRNVILSTNATPDLAVWVAADTPVAQLAFADVYARLDPWQLEEDEWLVDELLFSPDGSLDGRIVLLGGDDSVLWEQAVPPLPTGPVHFFRLSQQEAYALPVDSNNVQAGRYVVACQEDVTFNGEEAAPSLGEEPLFLPHLIKDHYAVAGIYTVSLPLEIRHEQRKVAELATSSTGLAAEPPYIAGQTPVPDLSPRVPPAFHNRDIWLIIPGATNRLLGRTSLWLRSQRGSFQRHMLRELDVEVDEAGTFWVPLRSLLAEDGGYYTVELRQGLRALLSAPLELIHVPGMKFVPPPKWPEEAPVYTPVDLPTARVKGITPEQIGNPAQVEAVPAEDGWLVVTWRDVRSDCRLLLRVNGQTIPLAWPVKRFDAWIEPTSHDDVFAPKELEEVTFRAVGSRDVVEFFFVSIAGDETKQQIKLDARGQFSKPLRRHGLWDMIRHQQGGRVEVEVSVFDHTWPLLVLQRYLELPHAEIVYDEDEAALLLDTGLKVGATGAYTFFARPPDEVGETRYQLAEMERLQPLHVIPCQLPAGYYRFEIWDGENILTLPTLTFQIGKVGETSPVTGTPTHTLATVSEQARDELAELITEVKEGEGELTAERLWRLATIPGPSLSLFDHDQLEGAWAPLAHLRIVRDVQSWEDRHGLLPAWVVTSRPLRFIFNQGAAVVYPEVALERGRHGVGYANLNFIHGLTRVYVAWEPASLDDGIVCVRFAVPPKSSSGKYRDVDDLNLEAVYQCKTCGFFLSDSQNRTGRHTHAGEAHLNLREAHNWTDDRPFLAKVAPCSTDAKLRHLQAPEEAIDREVIGDGLNSRQSYDFAIRKVSNVTTPSAHRSACSTWLRRYWEDSGARWHLTRLLSAASWQRAARNLEQYLASDFTDLPAAYKALARLLDAFHTRNDRSVYNLDRDLLLLALLTRHVSHDPVGAGAVQRRVGVDEALLRRVLFDAHTHAPELLQWAFTWAELFFVHSLT